ncbi:MAG: ADP-ribosylglycohydrolase family protein [Clostridia bacterium]|nr:ADP-ribosylglycohydrolase family protein [Clostridia bacterium]
MSDFINKVKAIVLGHAIGDALGVPVEFSEREELKDNPVTDMTGYGTYDVPAGCWSDDTSMSLCALDAISGEKVDFNLIMQNFAKWYNEAEYTATDEVFDIGNTCCKAILNYERGNPYYECGLSDERSNGNGSLMRIHPVALAAYLRKGDYSSKLYLIEKASALTHAHKRCKIACGIYSFVLWELIEKPDKESVFVGLKKAKEYYAYEQELAHFNALFNEDFAKTPVDKISGSGYVVDTLLAAVWCLLNTSNYSDCVLKAVNLGLDTDTVGAVTGGLAGALYGLNGIPQAWKNALLKCDYIEHLCEKAFK